MENDDDEEPDAAIERAKKILKAHFLIILTAVKSWDILDTLAKRGQFND
jgi:uncharacterized protein (DUF1778 family)